MNNWRIGDLVEQRTGYGEALLELGEQRQDIIVMDSDLQRSNKTYAFGQQFPERFFDMGIAEADMVSTAAGMAAMGYTVFVNSFAMFLPGRCYDQIRLQASYGNANLKLGGISAGITIGSDGASHQALDDIGLMRQLPNFTVIVPADATETYQATLEAARIKGPVYLRVSRYPSPVIYESRHQFVPGKPDLVKEGEDVVLFATGIMVEKGLQAAQLLEKKGVSAMLVNISTIKPLKKETLQSFWNGKRLIVTLEEHSIIGGLGSAVAEVAAESTSAPVLVRLGIRDCFGQSGSAEALLEYYGLTPHQISDSILESLLFNSKGAA